MAGVVANYAAKKVLGKTADKYKHKGVCGDEDPLYATIRDAKGNKKMVKRQIPDYIPEHDAKVLRRMRTASYKMDMALFNALGTRFGWSSVIGLLPFAGDGADAAISFFLVCYCSTVRCKLSTWTMMRMLLNIFIDFAIGLVPFLGDLADGYYKANTRNCRLLEKRLAEVYKPEGLKEPAGPASVVEEFDDEPKREVNNFANHREPRRPEAAMVSEKPRGSSRWYHGRSGREAQPDVERGNVPAPQTQRQDSRRGWI